ncbi:hypothetical protein BESB_015970 [Besnoitia besnoiti]|uniref:Uncharacterized protein n=1 Tax=Besnoitia besnoiti TaxID=94643 RepID=A0A2A9M2W1_BESBE|nr:hypothetical protein BESB_015970 [Besnoitia besnoiti]PFH32279.1 hypothetical protein BESB_015970 [Besnoitia besnoiti]
MTSASRASSSPHSSSVEEAPSATSQSASATPPLSSFARTCVFSSPACEDPSSPSPPSPLSPRAALPSSLSSLRDEDLPPLDLPSPGAAGGRKGTAAKKRTRGAGADPRGDAFQHRKTTQAWLRERERKRQKRRHAMLAELGLVDTEESAQTTAAFSTRDAADGGRRAAPSEQVCAMRSTHPPEDVQERKEGAAPVLRKVKANQLSSDEECESPRAHSLTRLSPSSFFADEARATAVAAAPTWRSALRQLWAHARSEFSAACNASSAREAPSRAAPVAQADRSDAAETDAQTGTAPAPLSLSSDTAPSADEGERGGSRGRGRARRKGTRSRRQGEGDARGEREEGRGRLLGAGRARIPAKKGGVRRSPPTEETREEDLFAEEGEEERQRRLAEEARRERESREADKQAQDTIEAVNKIWAMQMSEVNLREKEEEAVQEDALQFLRRKQLLLSQNTPPRSGGGGDDDSAYVLSASLQHLLGLSSRSASSVERQRSISCFAFCSLALKPRAAANLHRACLNLLADQREPAEAYDEELRLKLAVWDDSLDAPPPVPASSLPGFASLFSFSPAEKTSPPRVSKKPLPSRVIVGCRQRFGTLAEALGKLRGLPPCCRAAIRCEVDGDVCTHDTVFGDESLALEDDIQIDVCFPREASQPLPHAHGAAAHTNAQEATQDHAVPLNDGTILILDD